MASSASSSPSPTSRAVAADRSYPVHRPVLRLTTPLFHPSVSAEGQLAAGLLCPTWTAWQTNLLHFLQDFKRIFYDLTHCSTAEVLNQQAFDL